MICPSCGEAVDTNDRFCEACGSPASVQSETSEPNRACEACGAPASEAGPSDLCRRCGAWRSRTDDRREDDRGRVAAVSDRGQVRRRNEDSYSLAERDNCQAAVVCDGVATTTASALAAGAAARAAMAELRRGLENPHTWSALMGDAIRAAQGALSESSPYDVPVFQGSTTIAGALTRPGEVVVGNIGDSRAYWIGRDGTALLLTTDDSWARAAVVAGVPEAEAQISPRAHEITAWLGPDAGPIEPHIAEFVPDTDGLVVVCTDGLWNYVESPESMAALVVAGVEEAPGAIARRLVQFALDQGGADNVTVAVLDAPAPFRTTDHEPPSPRR